LGAFYVDAGDEKFHPQAEQALKKSLELNPSYPAFANLGLLYFDEKRYSEAADMTEKALKINDQNYIVWANLILAYQWLGDKAKTDAACEKAIHAAEQAIHARPSDALAHSVLASLYAQKGERERSLSQIDTALALAPANPNVLDSVGSAFESLGDRAKAKQYLKKALDAGYPFENLKNEADLQSLLKDQNFRVSGK
jgi:serine/threonine-protein kinase